ncbi:MAG: hypothetical protein QM648_03215 [Solirubrobacterales bacterium]
MAARPHPFLRLAAAALILALVAALALLAAPGGAFAAAKCKKGAQVWKVNRKSVCLKTARPSTGHAATSATGQLENWFSLLEAPGVLGRQKVAKKLSGKRTRAKAEAAAAKVLAKAQKASLHLRTHPRLRVFSSGGGDRGAVVDTLSEDVGSTTTSDGVTITAHVDAVAYADDTKTYDISVTAKRGKDALKFQPVIETRSAIVPEVTCPTADGKLTIDHEFTSGGSYSGFHDGKITGAYTIKTTGTLHAEGQVGRDAHLQSVRSLVSQKSEIYMRGKQLVATTSGEFTISRDGDPVRVGSLGADVSLKVAGLTRAQERAGEQAIAAELAASKDNADALASKAEVGRWRMKQDEHKWYDAPFQCADLHFSPDSVARLAAGQSAAVTASMTARESGAESAGSIAIASVERGQLALVKPELDPGAPARMTATAAAPNAEKTTVASKLIGASMAGRAEWGWYAEDSLDLPKKLSGVVSSWQEIPGSSQSYFHSWVVYTLDQVYVDKSGYISAWYKLTTADQDEVENKIGAPEGCHWEASGSGGAIADGDLELRKAPGGEWQHAIMYDVELADQTYTSVGCGAAPLPPFTGDLVGFLNMAMLGGSGFYPVEEGFHFQQTAVSHTDSASGRKTVADWILDPGDPQ